MSRGILDMLVKTTPKKLKIAEVVWKNILQQI